MIYFITPRKDHDPFIYKSQKITVVDEFSHFVEICKQLVLGFDTEFNGRRFFFNDLLLIQFGNNQDQCVFDFTELPEHAGWQQKVIQAIDENITSNHTLIFHNGKAEFNVCRRYNFKFTNLAKFYDTMIAEQRINLGTGLLNNYEDTYERRLKTFFPGDKSISEEFLLMNSTSKFLSKHITYAAGDLNLKTIAVVQKQILEATKQTWFTRNVEFPLVKILSDCEMRGLYLYEDKWQALIAKKETRKQECAKEMDAEVLRLGKGIPELLGGKYNLKRQTAILSQQDLFGADPVQIRNKNIHNTNYNSRNQVFDIIEKLGLPVPSFTDKGKTSDSLKEEAIQSYLMDHPGTIIKPFFEKLIEYKGLQKFISSYGMKFLRDRVRKDNKWEIGFKNPFTKRVHTLLKQCFTTTGRLSSGDVDEGLFNIQNLPAEKEVRECFGLSPQEIADGYYFSTIDLSGAELTIMAALANDQALFELGADRIINGVKVEGDMHSPTATACWRAVYQYRKAKYDALKIPVTAQTKEAQDLWFTIQDSYGKKYILTDDFVIDKKNNKQLRTDFKPMIFGCVYGLMAKKGGETLNIPKDEAQVVINVIKAKFPRTFKMVEAAADHAFRHGYVIFNNRSNNRRYFQPVLDILATINCNLYSDRDIINYVKEQLGFKQMSDIEKEARNAPIQGTQADMIKESMVEICNHHDYKACEASLLLSVHDENGFMHKGKTFGVTAKNIMIEVANRYLIPYSTNIRMGAELAGESKGEYLTTWTK